MNRMTELIDLAKPAASVADALGRPLRDLRISVTDRCNLRCTYCMPREVFGKDFVFLPRAELLSFEEIERVARRFLLLGVHKIRLSGGEPLMSVDAWAGWLPPPRRWRRASRTRIAVRSRPAGSTPTPTTASPRYCWRYRTTGRR